jgi:RNA polymerase sigma-70 factor (ECF subfamily)
MLDTDRHHLDDLAVHARSGDQDALSDLLAATWPMALGVCHRLLPHHHDAEEAAQDALLSVSTRLDSWDPQRGPFEPWARTVAANAARSTYRRLRRHAPPGLPDDAVDPVRTSVVAGSRVDLLDAMDRLESDHPAVVEAFVLRDLGGLSYGEIAALTDTPVGSVKARVSRARSFLRTRLGS